MKASELIAVLETVPADTIVGRLDHYGSIMPLFGARTSGIVREERTCENGWGRTAKPVPLVVLIECADLGSFE